MTRHCFYFLKEKFPEYEEIAKEVEIATVFKQPEVALILASNLIERLTNYLSEINKLDSLISFEHADRLRELFNENIIPLEQSTNFENIRKLSEKRDRHSDMLTFDDAYRMHRLLYEVLTWFYKEYGDPKFKPQEYMGPIYNTTIKPNTECIDNDEKSTGELKEDIETDTEVQPKGFAEEKTGEDDEIIILGDDEKGSFEPTSQIEYKTKDGSYLLYQLSKLSIQSNESVEGDSNLEPYKKYLHVERSIQKTFLDTLENIPEDSSHLILLCGSVGDGKSHLLAYLNSEKPDLASKFEICGDASVSIHSKKDAYETLSELLEPFNDNNFNSSNKKIIVGINLGALNDFIEFANENNSFKELIAHIEKSNVFESNILSQNYFGDILSIINFGDYNIFELTENSKNEVESYYLSSLIDKIVCQDDENPFFKAYNLDKENGFIHPILYNYEMLSSENVKKVIIELIVKISVKYKNFISTRSFLNFIHDILVPPIINQYDPSYSPSDYLEELLPNLLFSEYGDGFMKFLHLEDPTLLRLESLDDLIIKLNTNENILDVLDDYIDFSNISFFRDFLEYYGSLKDSTVSEKIIMNTFIRLVYIFQKDNMKNVFYDETYSNYLNYLYFYHKKDNSKYIDLFYEIIEAIFNFQGTIQRPNIIVKNLNNFFLAEKLDITPTANEKDFSLEDPNSQKLNRFKTDILLTFNINNNEKVSLNVDYSLYEYIIELNKGFKPNKKEEKTLIIFKEFIKEIINKLNSEKIILKNYKHDELFELSYNDFLRKFSWEVKQ